MLKIIRLGPPTRDCVRLQPGQVWGATNFDNFIYKNRNFKVNRHMHVSAKRHVCLGASCLLQNGLPIEARNRNVLSSRNSLCLPQRRHMSFQSSIESFTATQSGIFKAISESVPVEYCQKYLLYIHEVSGLPWWASIIISTVIVRTLITLPLAIYQQTIVARLENLKLELPAIAEELKQEVSMAVKLYNLDEKTARFAFKKSMKNQWDNLIIRDNCHPLKTTVLLWFQIPLWVSLSVSIRNLVYMLPLHDASAQITFTELMVGGFGFIPNLTIPDFSWIFPVSLGILNLAIIEIQVLSKNPSLQTSKIQKILTNTFRVVSLFMVPIAASVPSCLVLYWTTSSAYGLAQNLILMSPKVKRLLRIPQTEIEAKKPYQMILTNIKSKLKIA